MKNIKLYIEYINESGFKTFGGDILYAGKSKYPVGTKIKFKDSGIYYTGTLTHPFGFGSGDVGVYVDQEKVFVDDRINLRNREYTVVDDEVDDFIKQHNFKKEVGKYNL